jgi:hypothetical protein
MNSMRRMFVSFVIVLDIVGFFVILLIVANGSTLDDVRYIAEGDAVLTMVIALAGFICNIVMGYVLLRMSVSARRIDSRLQQEDRPRITGE